MTIDWFTFSAQIVNFIVLIWLMKRFLYGPVIKAMDEREAKIAAKLKDAALAEANASSRESEYQAELNSLAESRNRLLSEAQHDADEWKKEHLQKAREEVDHSRKLWEQAVARSRQALLQDIRQSIAVHATDVSRHVLAELAGEELDRLMVQRFIGLLKDKANVTDFFSQDSGTQQHLIVAASHPLSEEEQVQVREALAGLNVAGDDIEFRQMPELICGAELRTHDRKLTWNVKDLVGELQSELIANMPHADASDESVDESASQHQKSDVVDV